MAKKGNKDFATQPSFFETPKLVPKIIPVQIEEPKRLGMPIQKVFDKFALIKRRGMPNNLRQDLGRVEIRPEIKAKEKKEIEQGKRFSTTELKYWKQTVRFEIDSMTRRTNLKIAKGSDEEMRVFAAVNKFRQKISADRLWILDGTKLMTRMVMTDLAKHRPQK